jgi:hypothetical protein
VDEDVGAGRSFDDRRRRPCVSAQDELPSRACGPENLGGRHFLAAHQDHAFATLEASALGTVGNAERRGRLDVETTGTLVLDDCVADRGDAVFDREGLYAIAAALEDRVGFEFRRLDGVREPADDALQPGKQVSQTARSVDAERQLSAAQGERLEHPGKAEVVVGVEVREVDLLEFDQADVRA